MSWGPRHGPRAPTRSGHPGKAGAPLDKAALIGPPEVRHDGLHHPAHRNFVGYGANPLTPHWPDGARVAVSLVVNVEEGSEQTVLRGDAGERARL